jgi:hypothetical protein
MLNGRIESLYPAQDGGIMEQYYQIAGLKVKLDSFGRTEAQAEDYRSEPFADVDITVQSNREALKARAPYLSDDDCEYLSTGSCFYRQLLNFDGMLLHSSAVMMDGRAYLFTAPCGTGKSTHTKLWLQVFGQRAKILNDDKPALRLEDGTWYAYGTPWSGKTAQNINTKVPLAGICVLGRGENNRIVPLGGAKAVHDILEQTVRSADAGFMGKLLELLNQLVSSVPVWQLECNMEPQAALVSYEAMSRKEQ